MTTYVMSSRSNSGLALDRYLEQDHFSRLEGEISMWGTIETVGCTLLRGLGVKVISENERLEAYAKGEAEAERIFQPIYKQIERACEKENFQIELNRKEFGQKESVLKDIHKELGMGYRNKIAEYETKIQEATERLTELITKKVTEKFEQDQTIEDYKKAIGDYVKDLERQAVQDVVSKL